MTVEELAEKVNGSAAKVPDGPPGVIPPTAIEPSMTTVSPDSAPWAVRTAVTTADIAVVVNGLLPNVPEDLSGVMLKSCAPTKA